MVKQKSRFWSFIFSLIPGCGQMYLGFMKRGLSLLVISVGICLISSFTNMGELMLLATVAWCYSFFDALNLRSLDPESLAAKTDEYIAFDASLNSAFNGRVSSTRFVGIALVVFGAAVLWRSVVERLIDTLYGYNNELYALLWNVNNLLPRAAIAVLVIIAGVKLIKQKKQEVSSGEQD